MVGAESEPLCVFIPVWVNWINAWSWEETKSSWLYSNNKWQREVNHCYSRPITTWPLLQQSWHHNYYIFELYIHPHLTDTLDLKITNNSLFCLLSHNFIRLVQTMYQWMIYKDCTNYFTVKMVGSERVKYYHENNRTETKRFIMHWQHGTSQWELWVSSHHHNQESTWKIT